MAAMVAKWNSCPFCVGAHGAVAAKALQRAVLAATLADFVPPDLPEGLKATSGISGGHDAPAGATDRRDRKGRGLPQASVLKP